MAIKTVVYNHCNAHSILKSYYLIKILTTFRDNIVPGLVSQLPW